MMYKSFTLTIKTLVVFGLLQILWYALLEAYKIRLYAIEEYGRVIHEFDPYFNYRATEYLYANGWQKFKTWFDYKVWYPLGRPVGTTIYPGMQVTSVFIKEYILKEWSINDICCFVPAWFGVSATLAVALLTYECTRVTNNTKYSTVCLDIPVMAQLYKFVVAPLSKFLLSKFQFLTQSTWGLDATQSTLVTPLASATAAAWIMAIVPAHLLRSVGGGYDNEAIAMTAMVLTFYLWTRSLREGTSLTETTIFGGLTGLAYFYMVAAWGGYTFVLNLVGVHATFLVLLGRYSTKLYRAYTIFYVVGTILAIQVPVVGWSPIRSLEQMGPLLAFFGIQLMEVVEVLARKRKITSATKKWQLRVMVFGSAAMAGVLVAIMLYPTGYFGPISSRVRGLFVKHTKTGNPLVDSVAEHQAASPEAYFQYLHYVSLLAPVGFIMTSFFFWNDSSSFLFVYGIAAYFFSHKMVRLILLTAPIASVLAGIAIGRIVGYVYRVFVDEDIDLLMTLLKDDDGKDETKEKEDGEKSTKSKGKGKAKGKVTLSKSSAKDTSLAIYSRVSIVCLALASTRFAAPIVEEFWGLCHEMARQISHPTIIQKAQTRDGRVVKIDDYREAYFWLRDNTPEDARIMAWWDYGYQITGISDRTTIADGNTWNHEHIALLGRTLTAPEKEGHRIARHLADYVLVWAGGGGDDVAKSPHLRRIANSVYRGLCREPTCREYGFSQSGPSRDMRESLLYKLHSHRLQEGVEVDRNRFKEVFNSKYGKVRIYKILSVSKESKEWVADPVNRLCDAPGSWFCPGQYPPALEKVLKEKKDFKQLEDFNRKVEDDEASEYQKQYMENLMKRSDAQGRNKDGSVNQEGEKKLDVRKLSDIEIEGLNEQWEDTEVTTLVWNLISSGAVRELLQLLSERPELAHIRSSDGRGPMWWAYENKQETIIQWLRKLGVSEDRTDENGITPKQI